MAEYVDGYVLPVPKKHVKAYVAIAKTAAKVWMELGALEYRECEGDDLAVKGFVPFTKLAKCKPGETVFYSFIVYKSRAHRDKVNKAVMKDPRILAMVGKPMPFDMKRMSMGGFICRVRG